MRICLLYREASSPARRQPRSAVTRKVGRAVSAAAAVGMALACVGFAASEASASLAVNAAPSAALTAARVTPSPEVGMQDGWISRGGPLGSSVHGQGCDSNEENTDATPIPPPVFQTTIPTAVDDGAGWTNLKVRYERITVPWDIAYHHDRPVTVAGHPFDPNQVLDVEQACLNYWLADIEAFNKAHPGLLVQPQVQFRPDYNHLGTGPASGHVTAPSYQEYKAALDAFTRLYSCGASARPRATCPTPADPAATAYPAGTSPRVPRVATITPWGEPDFDVKGKPRPNGVQDGGYVYLPDGKSRLGEDTCGPSPNRTNCGPVLAAQMWVLAYHRCRNCTVIAGTFGSNWGKDHGYLAIYVHHLDGLRPRVWAIDDYTDVWLGYEQLCLEKKGRNAASCPVPSRQRTLLNAYSGWLFSYHYTAATARIWLGEISVFGINSFGTHQDFGPAIEDHAADYLLKDLASPGTYTAPGAPEVQRLYYMRYEDGAGYPDFALVLDDHGHQAPVPAYNAFRYRTNPR